MFLPVTVIQELEWVLGGVYRLHRDQVLEILEDLLAIGQVVVDRAAAIVDALKGYRKGVAFSDALHLAQSRHCDRMASFDRKFCQLAKARSVAPTVAVPRA